MNFIGKVSDVASSKLKQGYVSIDALIDYDTIYSEADVVDSPTESFQIKIHHSVSPGVVLASVPFSARGPFVSSEREGIQEYARRTRRDSTLNLAWGLLESGPRYLRLG
jgi:hypothetical protein